MWTSILSLVFLSFVNCAADVLPRGNLVFQTELTKAVQVDHSNNLIWQLAQEAKDVNAINIPELAKEIGLTELVDFVVKAKLAKALSGPGPFTVFGPTNHAFEALPDHVKKLLANTTLLAEVLTYHVLPGKIFSTALKNEQLAKTVQGSDVRINIYPKVNAATVNCQPLDLDNVDLLASNGIIHVLDGVLFMPFGNLAATADMLGYSTLVTAVKAASLVDTLTGKGPFTLFAPNNAAFAKLPPGVLDHLLKNKTALTAVLTYHVVSGTTCKAGLPFGTSNLATVNGASLRILNAGGVMVNNAQVLLPDIPCTNGVAHAIDQVLIPPSLKLSWIMSRPWP